MGPPVPRRLLLLKCNRWGAGACHLGRNGLGDATWFDYVESSSVLTWTANRATLPRKCMTLPAGQLGALSNLAFHTACLGKLQREGSFFALKQPHRCVCKSGITGITQWHPHSTGHHNEHAGWGLDLANDKM